MLEIFGSSADSNWRDCSCCVSKFSLSVIVMNGARFVTSVEEAEKMEGQVEEAYLANDAEIESAARKECKEQGLAVKGRKRLEKTYMAQLVIMTKHWQAKLGAVL